MKKSLRKMPSLYTMVEQGQRIPSFPAGRKVERGRRPLCSNGLARNHGTPQRSGRDTTYQSVVVLLFAIKPSVGAGSCCRYRP